MSVQLQQKGKNRDNQHWLFQVSISESGVLVSQEVS